MQNRAEHIEGFIEDIRLFRRALAGTSLHTEINITESQWLAIGHIFRNDRCTTNDAAKALEMSGSAVTQLVNGLVTKGFVVRKRDQKDRRAFRLMLSTESRKRIEAFKKKRMQMMLKMFEALTDEEFEQYLALNKKIIQKIKKK
jgi:DNA-binding MarR family transcriptional regulator